jgi:hypothetical protein
VRRAERRVEKWSDISTYNDSSRGEERRGKNRRRGEKEIRHDEWKVRGTILYDKGIARN